MEGKIGETKQLIEEGVKDAPVSDVLWNANQIETDKVRIIDPGVGKETILRHFFFKALPVLKGQARPTKRDIVSHFKRLIELSLYGDGFIIREDKPIEVHTLQAVKKISKTLYLKMKQEGSDFVILCLATPRAGVSVIDKPHKAV